MGEREVSEAEQAAQKGASLPRGGPPGGRGARRGRAYRLLPLVLVVGIAGGTSAALIGRSNTPALPGGAHQAAPGAGFFGTLAIPAKPAPATELRNYLGQSVTLARYRGEPVLLTFLYTHCPDVCPLITSNLRAALEMLGSRAARTQVIAISVDPRGDTPASVASFLRVHRMTGRMQYLVGSAAELARVWADWSVGSSREVGKPDRVAHSALVYGIAASGRITTLYPASFTPSQIVHDVPRLARS
jgi:protein SCO1